MKHIRTLIGITSMLATVVCMALAAGQACVTTYPQCPPIDGPLGNGSSNNGCADPNVWNFGDIIPMTFYVCNGADEHCENSSGNCNVMVRYDGFGRVLTCETAGWQVTCATSVGQGTALNIRCDNGQKCDPNGATDTIPPTIPPSAHSATVSLTTVFVYVNGP